MSSFAQSLAESDPFLPGAGAGSEPLLPSFLDGIADIAYMKDVEGRYLLINAAGARFLGKSPQEILGQDDFALFPPELAQRFLDQDRAILASGGSLTFEEEICRGDTTAHFQTVKSVSRDATGRVVGLVGIARDIGDRKALEEVLRQRERELSEARRIARLGTWRYDCATGETFWSEEIYRIYGLEPHESPAGPADCQKQTHYSAENHAFPAAFERAVAHGEPYSLDLELTRRDGSKRWILATGEVDRWENGKVASLRGTVQEITDRKRNERETALRENRYRSLVHATSQIVWSTDAEGSQLGAIPEWQAFTGQSDQDVLGFGWASAIHPDDRERTVREWQAAISSGDTFAAEHRLRRADGVYREMAVRAVPVRDDSGQIVEWVGTHTDITDQKRAQSESRLAHQRLQNVLESITDGLCVLDPDLRYVYFNETGARMCGLRPADIIGTRIGDTFAENKTNLIQRSYREALETGTPIHVEEFSFAPLNRWFESNAYPSADGLTVYFRDITDRKRTEQSLRNIESRFRQLFESRMIGIAIPDRFGGFKEGNDELLRITGYSRADLEAGLVRWDTMTPPEYGELDRAHIAEAAQHGSCTPYEKEYIRKDGTRVPILCGYALLEGSQDDYIGFVLDLTAQREAEADLRKREQRFRLLAEGLPALIWITDATGRLLYLNSRFLDYCGIPVESMAGFDWQTILHPDEAEHVNQAWGHAVRTGEPYRIELRMRSHDGSYRYFFARALPMRNAAGEVEQWVGSCADVHDRRLAEEALRRSEKLAATGRLAASIAHEINNPLTSVTNALYLALQDPHLHPQTRELLQTADEELVRVSQITTQTLRFHRQSKAATFSDLSEIMNSVLTLFRRRFQARDIAIVNQCAPDTRIWCLEDEMRQVFTNLVSNSLDAIACNGTLRIRIRAANAGNAAGVRVTVADSGCGISRENQHRIFEPFFSTKDSTGIGLGLWVSDGILRKHAAQIRIRSATSPQRHGTVFSILFPENAIPQPTPNP